MLNPIIYWGSAFFLIKIVKKGGSEFLQFHSFEIKETIMIKIAILYVRSNEDEHYTQTNPMSTQLDTLLKYCSEKNIAVLQKFGDIHHGTDFNRREFNRMLDYVEKYKEQINMILFTTRDRFSKDDAYQSNRMVAKLMSMEIEPRAILNPYFLEENTEEELKEWFEHFKKIYK